MAEIGVTQIFQLMNNEGWDWDRDEPKTYGLKYVTSKGLIRTRYNCRKNVKNIHTLKQKRDTTHSNRHNYDRAIKGLVQIYDEDTQEYRDISAANIIYFRNHGESRWLRIKN